MTVSASVLIAVAMALGGVLAWAFTKTYLLAVELTKLRGDLERAKKDHEEDEAAALIQRNNIGDKCRQVELKLFYATVMMCPEEKRQEVLNALVRRLT